MKKTAIFYGSTTGNTETIAKELAEMLDADLFDVSINPADKLGLYPNLVFGTSTWGIGDLQDDWEGFLDELKAADLQGKTVAIFGTGDADSYADSFVDGIGIIYKAIDNKGCKIVGFTEADDYSFDESQAFIDGHFVGLPLDEDNESQKTERRLINWVEALKLEIQ